MMYRSADAAAGYDTCSTYCSQHMKLVQEVLPDHVFRQLEEAVHPSLFLEEHLSHLVSNFPKRKGCRTQCPMVITFSNNPNPSLPIYLHIRNINTYWVVWTETTNQVLHILPSLGELDLLRNRLATRNIEVQRDEFDGDIHWKW